MPITQSWAKEETRGEAAPTGRGTAEMNAHGRYEVHSTIDPQLQRARQRIHDAQEWRETYDDANDYIMRRLAEEYAAGHKLSLQIIWEELRRYEWSGRRGESFRLNNSLRAAIARLIVRECPQYAGKLELRHSPLDEVFKVEGMA